MENLIWSILKILNSDVGETEKLNNLKELLDKDVNVKRVLDFESRELKGIEDIKINGFVDENRTIDEILKE